MGCLIRMQGIIPTDLREKKKKKEKEKGCLVREFSDPLPL